MNGEVFVSAAEASNEVVLEHMDGSLSSIAVVEVQQNKLAAEQWFMHTWVIYYPWFSSHHPSSGRQIQPT